MRDGVVALLTLAGVLSFVGLYLRSHYVTNPSDPLTVLARTCNGEALSQDTAGIRTIKPGTVAIMAKNGRFHPLNVKTDTRYRMVSSQELHEFVLCEEETTWVRGNPCNYTGDRMVWRSQHVARFTFARVADAVVVDRAFFTGPSPPPCPTATANSHTLYGKEIDEETIISWLRMKMR